MSCEIFYEIQKYYDTFGESLSEITYKEKFFSMHTVLTINNRFVFGPRIVGKYMCVVKGMAG